MREKGFVPILVLIVVAVGLLVIGGFAYFQIKTKTTSQTQTTTQEKPSPTQATSQANPMKTLQIPEGMSIVSCELVDKLPYGPYEIQGRSVYDASGIYDVGYLDLKGAVVSRKQKFWDTTIESIFLLIKPENMEERAELYQKWVREAKANNFAFGEEDGVLLFRLGVLDMGRFSSTATLDANFSGFLKESIDSQKTVNLRVTIPVIFGTDAPANWTSACNIEVL